jgi:predicted transcriptional regulator of viral defense system
MSAKPDYDQLYEIAEAQAGYFTTRQAKKAGFSGERLSANVKKGRFARDAQGVYRLNHFPGSPHEDLFVAWLRAGPSAVVSHESALSVYELSDVIPSEVHLIVPRTASRRRTGIRQHTNQLQADEITERNGLPITTVERTIADVIVSGGNPRSAAAWPDEPNRPASSGSPSWWEGEKNYREHSGGKVR